MLCGGGGIPLIKFYLMELSDKITNQCDLYSMLCIPCSHCPACLSVYLPTHSCFKRHSKKL